MTVSPPPTVTKARNTVVLRALAEWERRRAAVLLVAIALMVIAAVDHLTHETHRLLVDPGRDGAIDLRSQWDTVHRWFDGGPVYGDVITDNHPPASWLMLWPFLGWLGVDSARYFWALTTIPALAWLLYLTARASGLEDRLGRLAAALVPAAMYATGVTIGNGQLIVHVLPAVMTATLLLDPAARSATRPSLGLDLLASALLVFALIKPTVTAPLLLAVFAMTWRVRPALFTVVGYAVATLAAAAFRGANAIELLKAWLAVGVASATRGSTTGGYANAHTWLVAVGLGRFNGAVTLALLGALGIFILRSRRGDPWVMLGEAAIVARLFTYHRLYDDLLILLPMIALCRIAGDLVGGSVTTRVAGGLLLAVTWAAALAPARVLTYPPPLSSVFAFAQAVIWISAAVFLCWVGGARGAGTVCTPRSRAPDAEAAGLR